MVIQIKKKTQLRNSMALPVNTTLDQNYSTLSINKVRMWLIEKTTLYFLLIRDEDEYTQLH